MDFVCKDDDGDWYYEPDIQVYKRLKGEEVRSMISGQYLPDPHILLAKRKILYPDAKVSDISPTEATYALWEHWNARG